MTRQSKGPSGRGPSGKGQGPSRSGGRPGGSTGKSGGKPGGSTGKSGGKAGGSSGRPGGSFGKSAGSGASRGGQPGGSTGKSGGKPGGSSGRPGGSFGKSAGSGASRGGQAGRTFGESAGTGGKSRKPEGPGSTKGGKSGGYFDSPAGPGAKPGGRAAGRPGRGASAENLLKVGRGASAGNLPKVGRGAAAGNLPKAGPSEADERALLPLADGEAGESEAEIVWGRHAVLEALQGGRDVNKVWILRGLEDQALAGRIRRMAREKNAIVQEVDRAKLNALAPASHQGVVASLSAASYADFDALVEDARAAEKPLLLILDGIEDPHNLGALVRSAGAAGAQGVVIPRRRAVGLTGTVAKAAAGALEHVPVARTTNLGQALDALKKTGFWVVGAHQDAQKLAYDVDLTGPIAIVVGAEGPGLSRLTLEKCDLLVKFPMAGAVPSLNASVAGGLLLFEVVRQRSASS